MAKKVYGLPFNAHRGGDAIFAMTIILFTQGMF